MDTDLDLAQLRTLLAVVDEGSLDAAARRLHVTPSAVSQRLRALEAAAGRVLVRRGRPAAVTPAGEPLLRLARQVDLLVAEAVGAPSGDAAPVLPLAVNADSLATWLVPALAPLAGEVAFQLVGADQSRTTALLRDGSVTGAITSDAEPVAGCRVTALGRMRYLPCAAPSFAARRLRDLPGDLGTAPVVVFDRDDDLQHGYLRRRAGGALPGGPVHHVPSTEGFLAAVAAGLGWGMLPVAQLPARGVTCFDPSGATDVPLHWQHWRLPSPLLDRVTAALLEGARTALIR